MMNHAIRIGAVNYLNTKPLIYDLEELAPEAELVLDVPSRLARAAGGRAVGGRVDSRHRVLPRGSLLYRARHCHRLARPGPERHPFQSRPLARHSHAWPWMRDRGRAPP